MSLPLPHGYPDWQRVFAASQQFNVLALSTVISAPVVHATLTTVNIHSVGVRCIGNANHVELLLEWFTDQILTQFITADIISVRGSTTFDQTVTVKGAFLRITVTPRGGATSTYTLIIYEATSSSIPLINVTDPYIITHYPITIGAGANITTNYGRIVAGPAYLVAHTTAAVWEIDISGVDTTGAIYQIDSIRPGGTISTDAPRHLILPAMPVRSRIFNGDAAAKDFFINLTYKPLYP